MKRENFSMSLSSWLGSVMAIPPPVMLFGT